MRINDSNGVLDGGTNKTPLGQSLPRSMALKAQDVVTRNVGLCLPCTVQSVVGPSVVVIQFQVDSGDAVLPVMTVPVAKPPYVKYPIQPGDIGLAVSANTPLGAITGLGGSAPPLGGIIGNLGSLYFVWLGASSEAFLDSEAVTVEDNLVVSADKLAFFGGSKVAQQNITGALSAVVDANAKAVLTSIIDALANYSLATDGTT